MIKTSIVAENVHLSLVRSLFNEAKKYDDVIDFTEGDIDGIRPQFVSVAKMLSGLKAYFDNPQSKNSITNHL